ncbi:MAG: outer membrane beta-barrel domain-containing protein [Deltaproteobacteria bacterium]|nr:outer membrane beta-barrel domain-containing protein [Deltaproteobacteria bacterium]
MKKHLISALSLATLLGVATPAAAVEGPGIDALKAYKSGEIQQEVVMNRFFLKAERFEVAPQFGYVPNNPFAQRFVGGVVLGYHLSETFGAEAQLSYSPDMGEADLKGLTSMLVYIAGDSASEFQQPLDKVTLAAAFAGRWAPLYGKINLIGETVVNFDVYGVGGLAMLSKVDYYATYGGPEDIVVLNSRGNSVKIGAQAGIGMNFFINQSVALKLDARFNIYPDTIPAYDPNEQPTEQRLYNNFVTTAGVAFFFPKMKQRLYNF